MAKISSLKECQNALMEMLLFVDQICKKNSLSYWIDGGTLLGACRHNGFIPWDDDVDVCLPVGDYFKLLDILEKKCATHNRYNLFYFKNGLHYWCEYLGDYTLSAHGILPVRIDLIPIKSIENKHDKLSIDKSLVNIACFFIKGHFKEKDAIMSSHYEKYIGDFSNLLLRKEIFFKDFKTYLKSTSTLDKDALYTYSFNSSLVKRERPLYTYDDIFPLKSAKFMGNTLSVPNNVNRYLKILYGENYLTPPPVEKQKPYVDSYYKNEKHKSIINKQVRIFFSREDKHFIARSRKNKLSRYKHKFLSFVSFTVQCFENRIFSYWIVHLRFIIKKTIFGARF